MRRVSDEWAKEVISRGELPPMNLVSATDVCHDLLAARADAARLAEALKVYSHIPCPCCEGVNECEDGCTFSYDCPTEANRQEIAREALRLHDEGEK